MSVVLIIGAGGVSNVTVQKCAQVSEVFSQIVLASRTLAKCQTIAERVQQRYNITVNTAQLDANDRAATVRLIRQYKPDLVINLALPYQDLAVMDACLEGGVSYLDTANYEPPDVAHFEYKWQWAYQERFKHKKILALLGAGFDPGVTNVFCAYARKHLFDEIHTIDIVDCNGGDHGQSFATNFNPEINIREITAPGRYWEAGEWHTVPSLQVARDFDFPGVGPRKMYLMYHEELESLVKHLPGLQKIRFWMTFSENYLTHLRVLENVGMTRIDEVEYCGQKIVPLKFLKALLPDPGALAAHYTGKTCIGCVISGKKQGKPLCQFIYNICDHAATYQEVAAQAVSYTTGVPAMIGAKMILNGTWQGSGVYNMEQFNPDPFMQDLNLYGLPWEIKEWNPL